MKKIRKTVTLDEPLVELARTKLGMPLSTFFNICLSETLNASDEIDEVKTEISEHEHQLTILRSKLCRLEHDKQAEINLKQDFSKAMSVINRIYEAHGLVGENQIKNIANNYHLDWLALLEHCKSSGLKIVKGFEPVHEGRGNIGGSLR